MEEKVINHFCHEHLLILTEKVGNKKTRCYGCRKPVILESAYVCSQQYCPTDLTLHKKCANVPRRILHPSHPLHAVHLNDYRRSGWICSPCGRKSKCVIGYQCSFCDVNIDISCPKFSSLDLSQKISLQHPSHCHPLTLVRKLVFSFHCDGCGTVDEDNACMCSTCDFLIHTICASLPHTLSTNHHHHHLSLAFNFPIEHRKFVYTCNVCHGGFYSTYWVYYCNDCRYFAHVKCALISSMVIEAAPNSNTDGSDDLIEIPVDDISKELITPFIIRARENNGLHKIPDAKDMPPSVIMPETTASFSLLFNYHKHPLSLVSEGPIDELMICDVCVTPIYSLPYYNCATCNRYFLHSTCYFLPKTLCLDPQQYGDCQPTRQNHKLTAYTSSERDNKGLLFCRLCRYSTSGMVYKCKDCKLTIDVKCASLPKIIKHASHPQHKLIMRRIPKEEVLFGRPCGCGSINERRSFVAYFCTRDGCGFELSLGCVLRPQSIRDKWDKHPLLLTYDASVDHPTNFYCDFCEEEMHPKKWMYHCRECDRSFHPGCLTASGYDRNIKFGRLYEFDHGVHPHPLTYNPVSLKLRCEICFKKCYKQRGFECASCNYVVCHTCGVAELDYIM